MTNNPGSLQYCLSNSIFPSSCIYLVPLKPSSHFKFLVKWAKYIPVCRSVLNRSLAFDFMQTGIKKNQNISQDRTQDFKLQKFLSLNLLQLFVGSILILSQLSVAQDMSLELLTASELSNGLKSKH